MLALVVAFGCKAEDEGTNPPAGGSGGAGGAGGTGGASGESGASGASGEGGAGGTGGVGGVGGAGGAGGEVVGGQGGVGGEGGGGAGGAGGGAGDEPIDIRGTGDCAGLDSGFPGDEACLPAPDPSEGFQIHIGPEDYTNPGNWVIQPDQENSWCANFHLPDFEGGEVYYQGYVLSGRPGTHHIINTSYVASVAIVDGELGMICMDGGTGTNSNIYDNLPGASKAYMPRKRVAPENEGLGRKLVAGLPSQADMHYFNFTQDPLLREFWLNIYFVPKEQVTETAQQIRGMGGIDWLFAPIAPGTDKVYQYTCPIPAAGRITSLLGHYHAHGVRFTTYLKRAAGGQEKIFEMYDYNEPAEFQYDSVSANPMFSTNAAGAVSGTLEVAAGDELQWECHIINDSQAGLTYTNEVKTGEMCNLWGATVLAGDPKLNCVHTFGEVPFTIE